MTAATKANCSLTEIPSGIWALGFALNLMDFFFRDDRCPPFGLSGAGHFDGQGWRH
jgi:hypothetical protein